MHINIKYFVSVYRYILYTISTHISLNKVHIILDPKITLTFLSKKIRNIVKTWAVKSFLMSKLISCLFYKEVKTLANKPSSHGGIVIVI